MLEALGQWVVGAGSLLIASVAAVLLLAFCFSRDPDIENWRESFLFVAFIGGMCVAFTWGIYEIGGDIIAMLK